MNSNAEAHHLHFGIRSENTMEVNLLEEPSQQLWLAVLKRAVYDSQNGAAYYRREARYWLCSEDKGIGSFVWICTNLELAPDVVRLICLDKPVRRKALSEVNSKLPSSRFQVASSPYLV